MDEELNIFPFEIKKLDPETDAYYDQLFEGNVKGSVRVGPKGYFMTKIYPKLANDYYNLKIRPDHVFVGGFPRSGTNLTQQLVWLINNDLDYTKCDETYMQLKFRYLEIHTILPENLSQEKNNLYQYFLLPLDVMMHTTSFFKTHLPLSLLPPKLLETSKIVYVARDPRDAIVSFYYFHSGMFSYYKSDFKTMWKIFIKDTMIFCPYFEHVKEFWEKRDHPNLLFVFYEDILNDRMNTLRRVANFFNKTYTEEQLTGLCNHLEFDNLKNNKAFNHMELKEIGVMKPDSEPFIRKGKVGGWREHFDEEMTREADEWIANNLRNTDLRFPSIKL